MAVKVTLSPAQIELALAEIVTLAATNEVTVIVTVFEIAGEPTIGTNDEVMIQVTASPLFKDVVA